MIKKKSLKLQNGDWILRVYELGSISCQKVTIITGEAKLPENDKEKPGELGLGKADTKILITRSPKLLFFPPHMLEINVNWCMPSVKRCNLKTYK